MKERAIQFGVWGNLTGIVCEPAGVTEPGSRPGVVLLNSGILHRVGACRLHVQVARALAEIGFTSLRFDFSGIGDSEARRDALPFEESAPLEVIEAMDYLARARGLETFILFGLCSGADAAFHTAAADLRVVGLCQLDAWAYRTWRHHVHHYGPRICSASAWKGYLARRLGSSPSPQQELPGDDIALPTYVRVNPPRDIVARRLQDLVNRGTRLLHIYSGGQEDYNYRRQFRDAFRSVDFRNQLRLEYMPDATHIFTGHDHQKRVVSLVREWAISWRPEPVGVAHRRAVPA